MTKSVRMAGVIVVGVALLALSACGGSSPSPSSSASPPPTADLNALAKHMGAQQAWWMALTRAEAEDLLGELPDASSSPGASPTTYVVLMHGDFNDASGKPMAWEVATGTVGDNLTATVFSARPEVAGHTWAALALPSPQASP